MREIKFRGRTSSDLLNGLYTKGTWVYGGIAYDADRIWIDTPYYGQMLVDNNTVGQYTGLKDKNGKEIYEGDIVKVEYGEEDIGQIIYEHNGFTVDVMNMNRTYGRVSFVNNFMEVIGNIHENPELLEVEE